MSVSVPPGRRLAAVRHNLVVLAVLFGIGFYFIDAGIDALVFGEGTLLGQLLAPAGVEIWIRSFVFVLAIGFGLYAERLIRQERLSRLRAQRAERFLNSIFDHMPNVVLVKDAQDLRIVRANPAAHRLLGLERGEIVGKTDHEIFPASQAQSFAGRDRRALASLTPLEVLEEEITNQHGESRFFHTKAVPILDSAGEPLFLLDISEDVTERRQARLSILAEKERAERFLQISKAMIVGLDRHGRVTLINRRGQEILGYQEEEIVGKNWFETVISPTHRDAVFRVFEGIIAGESEAFGQFENEVLTKNGEIRYVAWNNSVRYDGARNIIGTLSSGQDVTERRAAELRAQRHQQQLAHVMRLNTMGEMASGIAHELNQPLTAITAYSQAAMAILRKTPAPPPHLAEILQKTVDQAFRAGRIIRHLREFIRKGSHQRETTTLDEVILEVLAFLEWEFRNNGISVTHELAARGCRISVDKVEIEQVLINLLQNCVDSFRNANIPAPHVTIESHLRPDRNIEVTIRDNGQGIDDKIRNILFQPFQSTKQDGIGLGLSISQSIIESHGGRLWSDDTATEGAAFSFVLPSCEA